MELVLLRHAPAVERDPLRWPNDLERPLTATGRRQSRRVALTLRRLGWIPDLVLTSRAVRTRETALGVVEGMRLGPDALKVSDALRPGGAFESVRAAVGGAAVARLLLVGHEPDLSIMAQGFLLQADDPSWDLALTKAGLIGLSLPETPDTGRPTLRFVVPARLLWR